MSPTGSKSVNQVHVRYGVWTGLKLKVDHDYDRWHRWPKNRWGCASLAVRTERSKSVKILKNQTFRVCWELFNSSNVAALLLEDIMFLLKFQVLLVFTWRHKNQTKKLSILPRFYFHDTLEQLKTNFHTNFCFKRVLGFVIEYALISKLLRDATFTWRPSELSCRLKKWLISGNFAI